MDESVEHLELAHISGGILTDTATMENSLDASREWDTCNTSTPRYHPQTGMHVFPKTIHMSPKLGGTQMSIYNRYKYILYIHTTEYQTAMEINRPQHEWGLEARHKRSHHDLKFKNRPN